MTGELSFGCSPTGASDFLSDPEEEVRKGHTNPLENRFVSGFSS